MLESGEVTGSRIAKSSYGALAPLPRPEIPYEERRFWSRFDTPGSTIYLTDQRRTAYLETLSPVRLNAQFRAASVFTAKLLGISEHDAEKMIEEDWVRNGNMVPGWLPASWRDGRLIYRVRANAPATWVDLTAAESVAAIATTIWGELELLDEPEVTLSTLTGENRPATTLIAEWIRETLLDDGNYADGIKFRSKYGGGMCWAYWMRRRDMDLDGDDVEVVAENQIAESDFDLQAVMEMYKIRTR